jgi:pyruvate/2-oxoglutarate dehydrogenase complex dihydrolipoamide acyltransferase (E2) component
MALTLRIPKLGWQMAEGTLTEWLVADGEEVTAGMPIYVLETDKVENQIDAPAAGTIRLLAEPGGTYPVGHTIAEIDGGSP